MRCKTFLLPQRSSFCQPDRADVLLFITHNFVTMGGGMPSCFLAKATCARKNP